MTEKTKRPKRNLPLSKKISRNIILLILCLFLFTAVSVGYMVYSTAYKLMMENLTSSSTSYNKIVEKDLHILEEQVNSIAKIAVSLGPDLSSPELNDKLDKMKGDYGFVTIYGINKDAQTSIPGITVESRDYFLASMKGEFFVSSPFLKSDDTVGITVSVPAYRDGVIDGIVSCGLPFDYFCSFVNFSSTTDTGAYIINSQGTMVAHTSTDLVNSFYNSIEGAKADASLSEQAQVISGFLNGDKSVQSYSTTGSSRNIAVASAIPGTDGWLLVTTVPQDKVTYTVVVVLLVILWIVFLGLLGGSLASRRLAKSICAPVQSVSERMKLLAQGDLSTDFAVIHSGDEIQQLSQAMSDTIGQMRGYIDEISTVVGQMANFNLDVRMTGDFKGEFAPIKESLNGIIAVLNSSFADINRAAEQVSTGSNQVAYGAQALAHGAVEQSSSVESLSLNVLEISEHINRNAANASSANERSGEVGVSIEESNSRMQDLLVAISDINATSSEIGRIIKTIEDIAFQTNILALNAAVEAARAGASGKGFAVVADEVRNLANKSSAAAKGTTELIEKSLQAVNKGTRLAQSAADSMQEVVGGVREVVGNIAQISDATVEQTSSINRITSGVEQISAVVQTNSATAEQSSASSEELSSQAELLKELVGKFRLNENMD